MSATDAGSTQNGVETAEPTSEVYSTARVATTHSDASDAQADQLITPNSSEPLAVAVEAGDEAHLTLMQRHTAESDVAEVSDESISSKNSDDFAIATAELESGVRPAATQLHASESDTAEAQKCDSVLSEKTRALRGSTAAERSIDKGPLTRKLCLVFHGLGWVLIFASFIGAVLVSKDRYNPEMVPALSQRLRVALPKGERFVGSDPNLRLLLPLSLIAGIAIINEANGVICSIGLRWALWREYRLVWNTPLQLYSSAKRTWSHHWAVNALYTLCLISSYSAASQVFVNFDQLIGFKNVPSHDPAMSGAIVNGVALITLTVSLFGMSVVALCSMIETRKLVQSWSTNPLNTALICSRNGLERTKGSSLMSATSYTPTPEIHPDTVQLRPPLRYQPSLHESSASARSVLFFIWLATFATCVWAIAFCAATWNRYSGINDDPTDPNTYSIHQILNDHIAIDSWDFHDQAMPMHGLAFAFTTVVQAYLTLALHCAGLLVAATQDAKTWRKAGTEQGALLDTNAFKQALTRVPNLLLLALKALVHWLFGLSITTQLSCIVLPFFNPRPTEPSIDIDFWGLPLCGLAGGMLILAALSTWLAFRKLKGPQPPAYGNLQLLVNLIDDWGQDGKPLFWGDKGEASAEQLEGSMLEGVRVSGTSSRREDLGEVRYDCMYL